MFVFYLIWIALGFGAAAATAALYGHYRVLPAWLTGPEVCLMEDGGCAVLFRSPRSRLWGVPNALLGVTLYVLLACGLLLHWPAWLLFVMTLPAVAMSLVLARSLIARQLQCRICWTGHVANVVLAVTLGASTFHLNVEATSLYAMESRGFRIESRAFRLPPSREALRRTAVALAEAGQAEDPEALYKQRESIPMAQRAEAIWAGRLAKDPKDVASAWKLARARYWLGTHAPATSGKAYLESGIAAARAAIAPAPNRPEGHFWLAANMGALAESFGLRQGLKYRGDIRNELETVLRLDPAFQQGSADRALGRWYFKVPGLFGGSLRKSEEHLRKSLTYDPNSAASLYFLAETLVGEGKKPDARIVLQQLLAAPLDPDWIPEDSEFKLKGRQLYRKLD
jgi:tetratricopeptide (TPR) repeat protein